MKINGNISEEKMSRERTNGENEENGENGGNAGTNGNGWNAAVERDLGIDYAGLVHMRGLKKAVYNAIKDVTSSLVVERYFDAHFEGRENIPARGSVIATHHCVNFDWMFLLYGLDRKCHGWFDECIIKKNSFLEKLFEVISVKTDGATRNDLRRNRELSRYWLENTDEFVVSVTDGPSKLCFHENGEIMELGERPLHTGLVDAAFKTGVPIVPYACWIPEEHRKALFASKGVRNDWAYLRKNKRIPYHGKFGAPLDPRDYDKKKHQLKMAVRDKQLEMEDYLRRK
jgi:1-acyl-sn-glycerol-3-phosphate acyltransferase